MRAEERIVLKVCLKSVAAVVGFVLGFDRARQERRNLHGALRRDERDVTQRVPQRAS